LAILVKSGNRFLDKFDANYINNFYFT